MYQHVNVSGIAPHRPDTRVLVVEDEDEVRSAIVAALAKDGFEVRAEANTTNIAAIVLGFRPDLLLLDIHLPGGPDGITAARRIRAAHDVPVIFVTSAGSEQERIAGFAVGADDYVVKPFSLAELVARTRAVLRRHRRLGRDVLRDGPIVVDEDSHLVSVNVSPVELTAIEFSLLARLCRSPGRVISKVQLLTDVWGFDHYSLNLVEVHISSLRKKLEAHGPRLIHTVRAVGYVIRG
jgi:DNA-binding response OmpR family regulator